MQLGQSPSSQVSLSISPHRQGSSISKQPSLSSSLSPAYVEQPWNLNPRLDSTISLIYLGIFSTGLAWLMRFRILKNNGLVFQAQVAYLIPIFGIILGYIFLDEIITPKVIVAVVAVVLGIYFVRKSSFRKVKSA